MTTLSLAPPGAPAATHHEELARLPSFEAGPADSRVERARAYLKVARAQVEAHHQGGASGLSVCRLTTHVMDGLLRGLWAELSAEHGLSDELALVALGGYGRRELAPYSDLDLLLLRPKDVRDEKLRSFAQAYNTLLWDLKLSVGWAVRTPPECARAAESDHTIRTALLDSRPVCGAQTLFDALANDVLRDLLTHKAEVFIAEKAAELRERREKFGDSIFLLEPNLKQGQGSLRDLESALWIAQVRFRTKGLTGLLKSSVLPASEVAVVRSARDFLLRIRNQLHYLRGRKEDRLTFDLQEAVARYFGYQEDEDGLPVEKFMRHYYLSAKAIRTAADALIARCDEVSHTAPRVSFFPEKRIGPFKVFRQKLTLAKDAELFSKEPATILRLFRVAEEEGLGIYSWARDQITQVLDKLEQARGTSEVTEELKALFCRVDTRGQFLFEMHELGVLGAVLPEFGRVTARHQHDLYHVYTVDIHSLFALRRLYQLRAGDLVDEQPELSRALRDLEDPLPLYLGMLFHDAGKGMGGNHSVRGKELMERVGERLGLSPRQREVAEFLVLKHLLMSHTAQRRDLSDPELIAEFARECGDLEKLTCLYLLTYADICSVGPNMWNDWKARLLKELYDKARAHLLGENRADHRGALEVAREQFRAAWSRILDEGRAQALADSLPDRYFLGTELSLATMHGRLLERARRVGFSARILNRAEAGLFTELTLCAPDRPGLLAYFAGVLAAHRIDILRARIVSTHDGLALDVFDVQAPGGKLVERRRWRAARADLLQVLVGGVEVDELLQKRMPQSSLFTRHLPRVTTKVTVDNTASARFSVVDVRAEDRTGLLFVIASALKAAGCQIALAKVATEANRAIDSFYVTRGGRKIEDPEEVAALQAHIAAAARQNVSGERSLHGAG